MKTAANRCEEVDIARTVCNVLVVVWHSLAVASYYDMHTWEVRCWHVVMQCAVLMAMPTLFLISGYLFFKNYDNDAWKAKMANRCTRLLLPYLLWNVVFVVFYLCLSPTIPRIHARVEMFGLTTAVGIFNKVCSPWLPPIDGPLWYMRSVFAYAILSYGMFKLYKISRWIPLAVLAAWSLVSFWGGYENSLEMICPVYSMICFWGGGYLALSKKELHKVLHGRWQTLLGLVFCCIMAYFVLTDNAGVYDAPWFRAAMSLGLLSLVWNAVPAIRRRWGSSRVYQEIRDASFFIYCAHFLVCSSIMHILAPKIKHIPFSFSVLVVTFVIGGIVTIILLRRLAMISFPRLYKILAGEGASIAADDGSKHEHI